VIAINAPVKNFKKRKRVNERTSDSITSNDKTGTDPRPEVFSESREHDELSASDRTQKAETKDEGALS
jgi:hypothetical protein